MEFKLQGGIGPWGSKPGHLRADIECTTLEEFLTYPSYLLIDGKMFHKTSYHVQNKTAYYERPPEITTMDSQTSGTFEVIDCYKEGPEGVRRTNITVK